MISNQQGLSDWISSGVSLIPAIIGEDGKKKPCEAFSGKSSMNLVDLVHRINHFNSDYVAARVGVVSGAGINLY